MAKGIDSFAHKGALEVGGKTIAVLPSGLKNIYPKENEELFNEILKNDGLVITEYEDYMEADSKKFLKRNRIVSALSIGILVVEGGKISGTSVTARIAEKQGKKVFCIPSSLENPKGIVPNKLIKEGAKLVTEVKDILNEYEELGFNEVRLKEICTKERITKKKISEEYIDIYNLLEENGCMNIDEITRQLNANSKDISYKLMMMELENNIVSLPGKNFKIK
jgi:DNA processing protein